MTRVVCGASTDVGHQRAINEDSFVAEGSVFLVADGMGGHERGEVASGLVSAEFQKLASLTTVDSDRVVEALHAAHDAIRASATADRGEMGTTLAALVLVGDSSTKRWLMINIGDSRVYRWAGGALQQLSVDHSVVQELMSSGRLSEADARTHPDRHVITRAVGVGPEIVADFSFRDLEQGERFLLCSDGLHGQLDVEQIASILAECVDPQEAATRLVAAVLEGRAPDNVTAVVVDVVVSDSGPSVIDVDTSPRDLIVPPESVLLAVADAAGGDVPSEPTEMIEVPSW